MTTPRLILSSTHRIFTLFALIALLGACDQRISSSTQRASTVEPMAPPAAGARGLSAPSFPQQAAPEDPTPSYAPLQRHIESSVAQDTQRVVLLHGYGANERDLIGAARRAGLEGELVGLRAPHEVGKGYGWFPIDFSGTGPRYDVEEIDAAVERVAAELKKIRMAEPDRSLVLFGFSQGAMITMILAAEHPELFSYGIALSGALPRPLEPSHTLDGHASSLFIGHGDADDVVSVERGREAKEELERLGVPVTYVEVEGMGHIIGPKITAALRRFPPLVFPQ